MVDAPAAPKKSRKRRDEDKGGTTWRKPLGRRFQKAIDARAGAKARTRAAFKGGKSLIAERQPPPGHSNLSDPDIADCMNPYEPPDACIDADYGAQQHCDFPQP